MEKKKPQLLYIVYSFGGKDQAFFINTLLREKALKKIGLKVKLFCFKGEKFSFPFELFKILKFIKEIDIVYIRVDGSSVLEKFSLLKLFKPNLCLIWEIHGQPKEVFWQDRGWETKMAVFKRDVKRRGLSWLVDGSICIDERLRVYSRNQLRINESFVIPSFFNHDLVEEVLNSRGVYQSGLELFKNKKIFKVIWGGGSAFKWQALDLIEKVARKTYTIDKEIVFLVIGSNKWYRFNFFKNIISLDSFPQKEFFYLIKQSSVCLALYHTDKQKTIGVPFYFSPLKLVEYMALGKPVIATAVGQIKEVIRDENNGFLTNNSVNDIVQKILYLKKNPSFSKKIGQKAQETVFKNYSLEKAAQKYKKIFRELNLV